MNLKNFLKCLVIAGLIVMILVCSYFVYKIRVIDKGKQNEEILNFENLFDLDEKSNVSESLLNMEGVLYIPSIDVKLPIYTGTEEAALVNGVGIIEGSGNINSINENPVLTAHNGLNGSTLLMNLDKMKVGNEFYTKNKEEKIRKYKVFDIKVVEPENEFKEFLKPKNKESLITLRTCTPTFINSHRLLVTGKEVDFNDNIIPESTSVLSIYEKALIIIGVLSFIALIIVIKKEIGGRKTYEN